MVYKESKWFISRLNGLQRVQMVYKQAEWFTSRLKSMQAS